MDHALDVEPAPSPDDVIIRRLDAWTDDGQSVTVALLLPRDSFAEGGPIRLDIAAQGLTIHGDRAEWVVMTRLGWMHVRGSGRMANGDRVPFRLDLFSAEAGGGSGDIVSLRAYAVASDPSRDGPVVKLRVTLPAGSVVRRDGGAALPGPVSPGR